MGEREPSAHRMSVEVNQVDPVVLARELKHGRLQVELRNAQLICPTPTKRAVRSEEKAEEVAVRMAIKFRLSQEPYLCSCGFWHIRAVWPNSNPTPPPPMTIEDL